MVAAADKRAGEIGGRIGEVVGGGRLEKAPERGVIGGERQLKEGAAAEHDQSERGRPASRRQHLGTALLAASSRAPAFPRRAAFIERERSSSTSTSRPGLGQRRRPFTELWARQGDQDQERRSRQSAP